MYGTGNATKAVPVVLGVTTAAVLPQTGMSNAIDIAIAVAAGLAVWAMVYTMRVKHGKR